MVMFIRLMIDLVSKLQFEESSLAMPRCKRARNRVQGIRACGGFARVGEAVTIPHGSHLVNFYVSLEDSNALV
jgi:hypothetical protein